MDMTLFAQIPIYIVAGAFVFLTSYILRNSRQNGKPVEMMQRLVRPFSTRPVPAQSSFPQPAGDSPDVPAA